MAFNALCLPPCCLPQATQNTTSQIACSRTHWTNSDWSARLSVESITSTPLKRVCSSQLIVFWLIPPSVIETLSSTFNFVFSRMLLLVLLCWVEQLPCICTSERESDWWPTSVGWWSNQSWLKYTIQPLITCADLVNQISWKHCWIFSSQQSPPIWLGLNSNLYLQIMNKQLLVPRRESLFVFLSMKAVNNK